MCNKSVRGNVNVSDWMITEVEASSMIEAILPGYVSRLNNELGNDAEGNSIWDWLDDT